MLFGLTLFVLINVEGLKAINQLSYYVLLMILLFLVSVFGSYRIWSWIKDGKM